MMNCFVKMFISGIDHLIIASLLYFFLSPLCCGFHLKIAPLTRNVNLSDIRHKGICCRLICGEYRRGSWAAMIDSSTASVFIRSGDRVRVAVDVWHRPSGSDVNRFSSRGFVGTVTDVWEKCEEDPHCCCAELAFDAPYEVSFKAEDCSIPAAAQSSSVISESSTEEDASSVIFKAHYTAYELEVLKL